MPDIDEPVKSTSATGDKTIQTSITDYTQKVHDWQTVNSKKRKVAEMSPPAKNQAAVQPDLRNRFQVLTEESTESNQTHKLVKPPPIFMQGIVNYSGMINKLAEFVDVDKIATKSLSNNTVKVIVDTPDIFRKLVKDLRTNGITFYTYQLKSDRAYKVVIRNLHYSTNIDEIKKALTDVGHEVRNVVNIRHWKTKEPLPLFYVDLEPRENNKSIYNLKSLLHTNIRVEAPHPHPVIVQCKRCQRYGHTKTYCTLPIVCVKCGEEHDNRLCKKPHDAPPKCGLCGGSHTANYRGCPEYKTITKTKNTSVPKPPLPLPENRNSPALLSRDRNIAHTSAPVKQPSRSYAEITSNKSIHPNPIENDRISRLEKLVENLTQQLGKMAERMDQMLTILVNITSNKP